MVLENRGLFWHLQNKFSYFVVIFDDFLEFFKSEFSIIIFVVDAYREKK